MWHLFSNHLEQISGWVISPHEMATNFPFFGTSFVKTLACRNTVCPEFIA